jgi:hypothetical protein
VKDAPLRGGNFTPQEMSWLPLAQRNIITLAATFPAVILPSGSRRAQVTSDPDVAFSINGQRPRSSVFLFDGIGNNNDVISGPSQPFTMTGRSCRRRLHFGSVQRSRTTTSALTGVIGSFWGLPD